MYADDLILLSPCVAGLQNMLDVCTVYDNDFDIVFNDKKVYFMVVGKRLKRTQASDITVCISGVAILYVDKIKYAGVSLSASFTLDVDVSFMQRRFYSSYNIL